MSISWRMNTCNVVLCPCNGESNGNPLQYSCLENPMDGGAWWAAVCGVARSWTQRSDFTFTFHFHALEKEMATHSSVLAWRMPGTAEPGGLPSMGSHRVGHDWSDLAATEYHSAKERNEGLKHATKWMNLESTMLSEEAKIQLYWYCRIPFIWNVQNGQSCSDRKYSTGCRGLGLGRIRRDFQRLWHREN